MFNTIVGTMTKFKLLSFFCCSLSLDWNGLWMEHFCLTLDMVGAGITCVARDTNINVMFHSGVQVNLADAQDL